MQDRRARRRSTPPGIHAVDVLLRARTPTRQCDKCADQKRHKQRLGEPGRAYGCIADANHCSDARNGDESRSVVEHANSPARRSMIRELLQWRRRSLRADELSAVTRAVSVGWSPETL